MLRQVDDLYIPQDERTLRRLQRRAEELERRVRVWAQSVLDVLPRGLALLDEELYILGLFLSQQRRLNMELDARNADPTLRGRLGRALPFIGDGDDDLEMLQAVHRIVSTRLESDIDRACGFFCRDRNIPAICDPAIDWRVAIRYMAQRIHSIACHIELKKDYASSPKRFEIALIARDQANEIVEGRRRMIAAFTTERI